MRGVDVVRRGPERVRVAPWRGDANVAHVTPLGEAPPVTAAMVRHCCSVLTERGYRSVVTGALARREQQGFLEDGFVVHEELHLLAHDLLDLPDRRATEHRTRRVLRRDRQDVLAIDHAAFDPFWRLDADALEDAVRATPSARFRIDREGHGYALTGRAGDRGYVQRLAVDPDTQGVGLGSALVIDGLWWLRRWRAREALVNTQVTNERAVALYERIGFRRRSDGLAVLEVVLGSHPVPEPPEPGPVP